MDSKEIMESFRRRSFLHLTNEEYDNLFANCLSLDTLMRINETLSLENTDVTIRIDVNGVSVPVEQVLDNLSSNFDELVVQVAKRMAEEAMSEPVRVIQNKLLDLAEATDALCGLVNWDSIYSDRLLKPQNVCYANSVCLLLKDGSRMTTIEGSIDVSEVVGVEICEVGKPRVVVCPREVREVELASDEDFPKLFGKAVPHEAFAIEDFNGKENMNALLSGGSPAAKAVREMGDGLYIPALGELLIVCRHKDEVNTFLKHIEGADLISQTNSWSSTEYSSYNAWVVDFSNGYVNIYSKHTSFVVRPVVAL